MSQGPTALPPRSQGRRPAGTGHNSEKKPKKPKKKRSALKVFFSLLVGLLLIAAGLVAYLYFKTSDAIGTIGLDESQATEVPISESVKQKPVAFVLMGLDSREKGGSLNTDVMMVAAFNPVTKTATVVSIPRDTYVEVDGYRGRKANRFYADFYTVARRDKDMEQQAAELEGKKSVKDVMGKLFGIDVKYAGIINFKGFIDVVDKLGGVKVNVDMRMKYKDSADGTDIDLHEGVQVLKGEDALDFVRYRKSNDGTNMSSDFDRNRRQSEVVGAIVDKMLSIGGITKVGSVIDSVSSNISMDMPQKEIKRMIDQYLSVRSNDIEFISLEGKWRSPNVYVDEASLEKARSALQAKMAE
ncbi:MULTISPECIES: LCP family protein [unclassified Paenibacillus]|uniref:LCP family protein n=1 Tax=unclassified Paenibacillus TaxID=185978 RepID=UPI0036D3B827